MARLVEQAAALGELSPDFMSMTYGAGGGGAAVRQRSIEASDLIGQTTGVPIVAHLALAGHTVAELDQAIDQFLARPVAGFMALRGDPVGGPSAEWAKSPGGLTYASELVALIRRRSALPIGVAAFPFGHPAAATLAADTAALQAKQAAGANFAITQVLFQARPYKRLLDRLAAAGLSLPVVPGIMPITSSARISKLELFHGAPLPTQLRSQLDAVAGDKAATAEVGLRWAIELVGDLLAAGAPGVHFYTLNAASTTARICAELGLKGGSGGAGAG